MFISIKCVQSDGNSNIKSHKSPPFISLLDLLIGGPPKEQIHLIDSPVMVDFSIGKIFSEGAADSTEKTKLVNCSISTCRPFFHGGKLPPHL
jgi:hypothetical protein